MVIFGEGCWDEVARWAKAKQSEGELIELDNKEVDIFKKNDISNKCYFCVG